MTCVCCKCGNTRKIENMQSIMFFHAEYYLCLDCIYDLMKGGNEDKQKSKEPDKYFCLDCRKSFNELVICHQYGFRHCPYCQKTNFIWREHCELLNQILDWYGSK